MKRASAALLAASVVGIAAVSAAPAFAAVQPGPFTIAPTDGYNKVDTFALNTGGATPGPKVDAWLTCPEGDSALGFLSAPGQEEPTLTESRLFYEQGYTVVQYSGSVIVDGQVDQPEQLFVSSGWLDAKFNQSDLATFLAAGTTYSVGLVCGDGRTGLLSADAAGKPIVVFGTLTVDAAGQTWSYSIPKKASTVELAAATDGAYAAKLSATVPKDATGEVEFFEGDTSVGKAAVSNGTAALRVTGLTVGPHSYTASYLGDTAYDPSARSTPASVTIEFAKVDTTVAISAVLEGETRATVTATVTADGKPAESASGKIEFFHDGDSVGTVDLKDGVATTSMADLDPGTTNEFTAAYAGDTTYNPSASATVSLTTPAAPVPFKAGDKLVPGTRYVVEAPAGTFKDGDTVSGVVNSAPITLAETAVANADGSARYVFTLPAELAQSTEAQHTLVLTGTPSGATLALAFAIDAAAAPGSTPAPSTGTVGSPAGGTASSSGGSLPSTGFDGGAFALTAGLGGTALILAGGALMALRRRRGISAA
ncbi:Ig-like domain-containing protein [Microbacterium sp. P04]|uniref:Ig-like domain-containing protein n=1 Tax=Microbacterium sp. P04 TaxID=3366947 RepID=UPI003745FE73